MLLSPGTRVLQALNVCLLSYISSIQNTEFVYIEYITKCYKKVMRIVENKLEN